MFALSKWYLDLVTDDGVALIGYAARLRWGAVRLGYSAVIRSRPGQPVEEQSSIRRSEPPEDAGEVISWAAAPLGLAGRWEREAPAIEATLLDDDHGRIHWQCRMPSARAPVTWGGATHQGRGYAELLRLEVPPDALPFRTLRWGRHGSAGHSVVWIEWVGQTDRRWGWVDGVETPGLRLESDGVGLGGGRSLRFADARDLRKQPVAPAIAALAPVLGRRLGSMAAMREHKVLSRSAFVATGAPTELGWAIHEEVTW